MEVKLNKKKTIAHYNKLGPNMQKSEHSAKGTTRVGSIQV